MVSCAGISLAAQCTGLIREESGAEGPWGRQCSQGALLCRVLESNPDTTTVWFTRGNSSPENKGHSPVLGRGHERKTDSHGKVETHK